jgi:hypothetical protein
VDDEYASTSLLFKDRLSTTVSIANAISTGYPDLNLDAFQAPREIEEYNDRYKLYTKNPSLNSDSSAYLHTTTFFDGVVKALKEIQGHIKIEILRGELVQQMSQMKFKGDGSRPAGFPRSFTRAWLSNVP